MITRIKLKEIVNYYYPFFNQIKQKIKTIYSFNLILSEYNHSYLFAFIRKLYHIIFRLSINCDKKFEFYLTKGSKNDNIYRLSLANCD